MESAERKETAQMAERHKKFLVEIMHFSNPYFFIIYFYIGIAIYLIFSHMGGYEILASDLISRVVLVLFGVPIAAFAVKDILTKIYLYLDLEIHSNEKSPLHALFDSDDKFLKYRDGVLKRIFSWEKIISFLCMLILALIFISYDVFIAHSFENAAFWHVLIFVVYRYAWFWVVGFAGVGLAWGIFCVIAAISRIDRIEQTEGLRITESIKTLKVLTNVEEKDENTMKNLLKGYYSYTEFLIDYGKIIEIIYRIAMLVAFIAILYTLGYIGIAGLSFKDWNLPRVGLTIGIDFFAIGLFIIPQLSAHRLLKRAKREIYTTIHDVYEHHKLRLLNKYAFFSPVESSMAKDIELLKKMVDETGDSRTWPVEIGAVLRLTAVTVMPLILLILRSFF